MSWGSTPPTPSPGMQFQPFMYLYRHHNVTDLQ